MSERKITLWVLTHPDLPNSGLYNRVPTITFESTITKVVREGKGPVFSLSLVTTHLCHKTSDVVNRTGVPEILGGPRG